MVIRDRLCLDVVRERLEFEGARLFNQVELTASSGER